MGWFFGACFDSFCTDAGPEVLTRPCCCSWFDVWFTGDLLYGFSPLLCLNAAAVSLSPECSFYITGPSLLNSVDVMTKLWPHIKTFEDGAFSIEFDVKWWSGLQARLKGLNVLGCLIKKRVQHVKELKYTCNLRFAALNPCEGTERERTLGPPTPVNDWWKGSTLWPSGCSSAAVTKKTSVGRNRTHSHFHIPQSLLSHLAQFPKTISDH